MKNLITLITVFLVITGYCFGQKAESFDIITFQTPAGWQKEVKQNVVQFGVDNANGGICLVTLFKSIPAISSNSKENFEASWQQIVKGLVTVKDKPQMNASADENGWTAESGIAQYESDGKKGLVMLVTLTGGKKLVNILILTNTQDYQDSIAKFLESIVLPKAATETAENNSGQTGASSQTTSRLIGKWNRSGSVVPVYADPVSWGTAGYTKSRYEFRADGSYSFTERSFRMMYQNILVVKESGKYTVEGNQITISPQKSVIEAYSKRGGVDELGGLVKNQNRELEKITYQFTFYYFSGIDEWDLVLQAENPTQRDGPFSNNTTFKNAWYFDQKYNDTDLTSPKGN